MANCKELSFVLSALPFLLPAVLKTGQVGYKNLFSNSSDWIALSTRALC